MKSDREQQVSVYLSGELSNDQRASLFTWVGESAAHADHFAQACALDQLTQELFAEGRVSLAAGGRHRSSSLKRWPLVAAAVVLVSLTLIGLFLPTQDPSFARISQSVAARGDDGKVIVANRRTGAETIRLQQGLLRIDFDNGASMTVEGPAKVELRDLTHAYLHFGVATIHVPESAHGFTVDTADAEVVDLGTAFGLARDQDGRTHVCVFEGEVEVDGQRVGEGEAVQTGGKAALEHRNFETTRYEKAWPLTAGVLQTTGMMRVVPPGPGLVPGAYEDSSRFVVFLERQHALLEQDLTVDLADPGEFRRLRRQAGPQIAAGTAVRSYLLQLDPVGQLPKNDPGKSRVNGQITFDRPILGVIAGNDKLLATDVLLGHPQGNYGHLPRGAEPPKQKHLELEGRDIVILAADQRTLILNMAAGSAVDQLRVLIAP